MWRGCVEQILHVVFTHQLVIKILIKKTKHSKWNDDKFVYKKMVYDIKICIYG